MLFKRLSYHPPALRQPSVSLSSLLSLILCLTSCVSAGNRAPRFLQLEDHTISTNQAAQIDILVADADQDFVSFSFTLTPPPPTQTEGSSGQPTLQKVGAYQAVFSWTPGNADEGSYALNLVVEDEQGASSEESISLSVIDRGVAGGEVVRFVEPTGEVILFDVSEGSCLEAGVTLEAASLTPDELFLTLGPDAPAGMMVANEGNKRYALTWCPSPAQLSATSQYPVSLIASNTRGLPNVVKRLLVLIRSQGGEDCMGAPPEVIYSPLGEQRGLGNVEVEVTVRDDLGIKSVPTLSYRYRHDSDWTSVVMQRDPFGSEELWVGLIPPSDSAQDVRVQYYVSARDDDDPMGTLCDHLTEGEVQEFLWVWDESLTPSYELCEPCHLDQQCGDIDDLCVLPLGTVEGGRGGLEGVCGRSCDEQLRCPEPYECVQVMSRGGRSERQCVMSRGCGVECVADQYDQVELNQTEASASPISVGEHPNLSICDQDVDWFVVSLEPNQDVRVALDFIHQQGDLDLQVRLDGVTPSRSDLSNGSADGELIEFTTPCIDMTTGPLQLFIQVVGYNNAQNGYGLTVSQSPSVGGCQSACTSVQDCPVGSYCTGGSCVSASCGSASCAEGLTCLGPQAGLTARESEGLCASVCESNQSCRVGERCTRFDDFRSYCVPTGEGRAGEPCASFTDCGEAMICFPNGASGFCAVANCSSGSCQSGTVCADVGVGGRACVVGCETDAECASFGLTCRELNGARGCAP